MLNTGCRVKEQRSCALDIMLFTEQVPRSDPFMPSLFPVNALRCVLIIPLLPEDHRWCVVLSGALR